jgi:O-antigen ligase
MALRARLPLLSAQAAMLGAAAMFGLLAGIDAKLAVVAALSVAFTAIVIADLAIGVTLFAVLAFVDVLPLGGAALTFTKAAGLLLALSWLATIATNPDTRSDFFSAHPAFGYLLLALVAWMAVTVLWAENPGHALSALYRWVLQITLFLIAFTAVRRRNHAVWVVAAFLVGATVSAAYGLAFPAPPQSAEDVSRLGGAGIDPNQLATVMVAGLPLAAAFAVGWKRQPGVRLLALGVMAFCALSVFLSLSRTGLVALAVALIATVLVAGRWRTPAVLLLVSVSVVAFGYFSFYASADQRERISATDGGTGRSDIWTVGWRMVEANPLQGVGVGNFSNSSIHYLLAPGSIRRDEFIVDDPKVAHNVYLEVLAEIGIPGLLAFVAVLLFALVCTVRAAADFRRSGDLQMEVLARGLCVALVGTFAANFFISGQFSKQLWILLALGPAMLQVARSARENA